MKIEQEWLNELIDIIEAIDTDHLEYSYGAYLTEQEFFDDIAMDELFDRL